MMEMSQGPKKLLCDSSFCHKSQIAVGGVVLADKPDVIETWTFNENNNIRAEIRTVIWVLETFSQVKDVILLSTDCQTVVKLPERQAKLEGNNYCNRNGDQLANADLYRHFFRLFHSRELELQWVKGHRKKSERTETDRLFAKVDQAVRAQLREAIQHKN